MELVISHLFGVAITLKRHVIQHSSFSNFIWDVFTKLQINLKNNGSLPWSEKAVIFSWNCFTEGISLLALENNPQATSRSKDNIQDSCLLASWMEELCHKHCICVLTFVAETPVTLGCCMQTWLTNKGKLNYVLQHNCGSSERWAQPKKMFEVFNHTLLSGFSKEASYNPDA